jgi:hypothetical protein
MAQAGRELRLALKEHLLAPTAQRAALVVAARR